MQTSSLRALKLWAYVLAVQTTNVRVQASRPSSRQSVYHLLHQVRHRQKRPLSETYQTLMLNITEMSRHNFLDGFERRVAS